MSLRFIDGFDHYSSTEIILKWPQAYNAIGTQSINSTAGRDGKGAVSIMPNNNPSLLQRQFDPQSSWYFGTAFKVSGFGSQQGIIAEFRDYGTSAQQCRLVLTTIGCLQLQRNGTALATSTNPIAINQWYYVEFKLIINGTTGVAETRLNGTVVATFTGNTQGAGVGTADSLRLGFDNNPGSPTFYWDDLWLCDGQTGLTGYQGDCSVKLLLPNAAGADAQFAQTGGTAGQPWTAVNDVTPNGDTSYLSDATVGDSQTLAFQDLAAAYQVKGVAVNAELRKDDAGTRTIQLIARPTTVDYLGSSVSPNTTYSMTQTVWENNPETSAGWTASDVNGAEFGIKNVS